MGTVQSSLHNSAGWIRTQGLALTGRDQGQQERRQARRRRQRRVRRNSGNRTRDVEAHGGDFFSDEDTEDDDCLDDEDDDDTLNLTGDEDNHSFLEGGDDSTSPGKSAYDTHPLYFGPAFHPVIEQSPAQLQLQRQIEQQLEQQQYRHQQQNASPQSAIGSQQLSLSDFILPSAISGLGVGSGVQGGVGSSPPSGQRSVTESMQDQLYRNNNLYNLLSGLNVNALLTEVQRAGTLDLSVLEQELDDVEGGWMDIDDDDEDEQGGQRDDADVDNRHQGIVREMQPTMRSPTALACSVNLKKSTLRLVKNFSISSDPSIPAPSPLRPNYRLDFTFDSLTPCDVKLFWVVKEVEENGELGFRLRRLHHLPQPTTYHFPSGMNQQFVSPILPLYTMSLPELTMQGLPSTSMRMYQKRNQRIWQHISTMDKDRAEAQDLDDDDNAMTTDGRVRKSKSTKKATKAGKTGSESTEGHNSRKYGGGYSNLEDDAFKPIMEDQYFSLVILIEATEEYKATGPVRSLPTPVVDSPGLYLVENQAISTFASFNINSEGGFEIKVMKQKVWINSTNYLIQEIFGFTDSVASAPAKATETAAAKNKQPAQRRSSHKTLLRSLSRLSRAESIASRVDELTKDRPKRKKKGQKHRSESNTTTTATTNAESTGGNSQNRGSFKESAAVDPNTIDAEPEAWRSSVVSTSTRRRDSEHSVRSAASQTTSVNGAEANHEQGQKEEEEEYDEEGEEEEEGEEPNLVLLDTPECVICLSDVKDTIVLPCRHFCICSECGDVLRRRVPQRCPICRQVFQALLHIASTSTHKPEFAMVHSPTLRSPTDDVIHGHNTQYAVRA